MCAGVEYIHLHTISFTLLFATALYLCINMRGHEEAATLTHTQHTMEHNEPIGYAVKIHTQKHNKYSVVKLWKWFFQHTHACLHMP